jgi:hypothetical protein
MAGQENTQKEFQGCCEGMPFTDMMRKMMETKKTGHHFNCAEVMSQMMQMCCGARERKEKTTEETKKNSAPTG